MRIALVLVIGCGAPARPIANQPPGQPPVAHEPVRQFRQLVTGSKLGHAKRTTFQLAFDGDRASLVETEERAQVASIADADRATWSVRSTRTYRGARKAITAGIELHLATDDMQPLHLQCAAKTVQVAATGAHRAATCDALDPPGTAPADALVCTAAGQPTDDVDDDDRLVFAPAPGIELVSQHDDCTLSGLRRAR